MRPACLIGLHRWVSIEEFDGRVLLSHREDGLLRIYWRCQHCPAERATRPQRVHHFEQRRVRNG